MKHIRIIRLVAAAAMVFAAGEAYSQSSPSAAVATHDWSPADNTAISASTSAPPPSAPPKRGAAELEKLVAPIALYPDPLIAVILPASAYPLEIVQAARFVKDTNNIPHIDQQPWDQNVKAVACFPEVIGKMDADLAWTVALGQAFQEQDLDVMNAIQALRAKANTAGTLRSTPQQVVTVTNAIVERTYEQQIVYVTNTIVQIQPADPQVIYVPQYNPTVVYAPPPTYTYDPLVPLLTFGAGIAVGAIIANNCCNWYYGGVYYGGGGFVAWGGGWGHPCYYPPPYHGYRPPPYYPPPGYRPPYYPPSSGGYPPGYHPPPGYRPPPGYTPPSGGKPPAATPYPSQRPSSSVATQTPATMQRWQPDQSRLRTAGAWSGTQSFAQRGWVSPKQTSNWQPATTTAGSMTRPVGSTSWNTAPGSASGSSRASAPSTAYNRPATTPAPASGQRPAASTWAPQSPGSSQGAAASTWSRQSQAAASSTGATRGSPGYSSPSAFGGVSSGSSAWSSSQRGATSRSGGYSAGSSFGGSSLGSGKGGGFSSGSGGKGGRP